MKVVFLALSVLKDWEFGKGCLEFGNDVRQKPYISFRTGSR